MSESTAFEDLELLDGDDLKAVFDQLEPHEVTAALWGANVALRGRLLRKLSKRHSRGIEAAIIATDHCSFEQVLNAQQKAIAELVRLSRAGQIAFDVAEDMAA